MRSSRTIIALSALAVALGASAWLLTSVGEMHDRLAKYSDKAALAFLGAAALAASGAAIAAVRFFWSASRARPPVAKAPEDIVRAAEVQAEKAEEIIALVGDREAKGRLNQELAALRTDRQGRNFHVVVFGTGSAGKTSLINAILGRHAGKTEAVMGTTQRGETFTHSFEGVDGTLLVTDTPGLSEFGAGGAQREAEARDLAARADLLLFVVDHDLVRAEYEPLVALARQGKRSIVVLNKVDRRIDADRDTILDKLRERLRGIVAPDDVVAVAAAPQSTLVRRVLADGSVESVSEPEPPDLGALESRIAAILRREGDALRAGNLLLRAHLLSKKAQEALGRERDLRAQAVIDKFQWITAGAVFANPIPALDLMAAGAVQFQMITELASVYQVEVAAVHLKMIGAQMAQMLLKLGLVEATTSLVAGVFKSSLLGYAAGGAVQAVSMAYLTHISGHAFADYFAKGQTWGDGGMQAALIRQFDLNSRVEFLQEFAKQAIDRVVTRALKGTQEPAKKVP